MWQNGVGLVLASLLMAAAWYVWSGRNSYVCRDEDGQQVGTAATLEAAIAATPDGGIVEISGFGDVTVTETILLEKSIELVGVGNHPARLLAGEALDGPLFLVGAPCNFTNLNIENRHGEGSSDVVSVMEICCGGVVLRHCTLMHEGGTTVLIEDADTVEFIDCHLSNIDGIAAMDAVEESVGRSTADAISDINTEPELSDRMFDFVVRYR